MPPYKIFSYYCLWFKSKPLKLLSSPLAIVGGGNNNILINNILVNKVLLPRSWKNAPKKPHAVIRTGFFDYAV